MLSRNDQPFGFNFNPFTQSVFNLKNIFPGSISPPVENDFLLLDGSNFLLLDGTNFLLL